MNYPPKSPTPPVNPPPPVADWLERGKNLADLTNKGAARTALELGELATMDVEDLPDGIELSDANPVAPGAAAPGTSPLAARGDHRHPTDTTRAPLASPVFTGTPEAPTAAVTVNSTQLATTAWARNFLASSQRVTLGTVAAFWAVTKSGGGAESFGPLGARLTCGAESSLVRIFSTTGNSPVARGSNTEIINFSKRVGISFKLAKIFANANSTARVTIGKVTGDGHGALARKSFGFIIENLTLKGIVHNGTTQTVGAVGFTMTSGTIYALHAISDGAGNVSFFVNDTLIETVAGGPTGNSSSQGGVMFELDNNASSDACSAAISPVDLIFPA